MRSKVPTYTDFCQAFGRVFHQMLIDRGITAYAVARRMDRRMETVYGWRSGDTMPSGRDLYLLNRYFKFPLKGIAKELKNVRTV